MTRVRAKKWIEEIKAFANGADILCYTRSSKAWDTVKYPYWEVDAIYVIGDKHVEARKAFALGQKIELRTQAGWYDIAKPTWDTDDIYRPKPKWEPKLGEMIMVKYSMEDGWVEREFICRTKNKEVFVCHTLSGNCVAHWKYAKEKVNE